MKKGKLRIVEDGMLVFYCPGCKRMHDIYVDKLHHVNWNFNGDFDKPTFSPSIKVTYRHPKGYSNENPAPAEWSGEYEEDVCHSFVRDGKIQYLSDCTHDLAGQTVNMVGPDYDENEGD